MENGRRGWTRGCLSVLMRLKISRFQTTPRHGSPAETDLVGPIVEATFDQWGCPAASALCLAALSCGGCPKLPIGGASVNCQGLESHQHAGQCPTSQSPLFTWRDSKRAIIKFLVCPPHLSLPVMSCNRVVLLIIDTGVYRLHLARQVMKIGHETVRSRYGWHGSQTWAGRGR